MPKYAAFVGSLLLMSTLLALPSAEAKKKQKEEPPPPTPEMALPGIQDKISSGMISPPVQVAVEPAVSFLTEPWTGPYGGVPPWDKIQVSSFKPAFLAAMNEARAELESIAADPAAPTFQNTIVPYEKAGRKYGRVEAVWYVYTGNLNTPDVSALEQELEPVLQGFRDEITQNERLFKRIAAVYDTTTAAPDHLGLNSEQQRLVWRHYTNFARSGAKLDATAKAELSAINQRLATLFTDFRQHVMADEVSGTTYFTNEADLAGLPQSIKDGMAAAAEEAGKKGQWALVNTRSSFEPFLTYSTRRDLREKVWRAFVSRGDNGDATDNNKVIPEILELRLKRAKLLGFETHAHWQLDNAMAKTPEAAMKLMLDIWGPAVARVHEEVADMQKLANKEAGKGKKITIEPWDYRFYAEKVRLDKYSVDEATVKPYLQLEKLREGMFWVAGELYGFTFTQVTDVPVFHPDVRVWKVTDATGKERGLFYFDPYARSGKQPGAWMTQYRNQERFDGEIITLVSNNSNFVKGKPGEPILVSWDDALTLFHEFGHGIHGLSSNVTYPGVSGTNVATDYVELPSQIMEHWLPTPQVLQKFALHVQTGQPMPKELVEKLDKASKFNQGFGTVEFLSSAILDMKLHMAKEIPQDMRAYEKQALAELKMPREMVMRHRLPQFNHLFSSDGYSAGYYSYLWADTLVADAWEAFEKAGVYDKATAKSFYDNVLSVGNTIDPAVGYKKFRGKDPTYEALMRDRGFPLPK